METDKLINLILVGLMFCVALELIFNWNIDNWNIDNWALVILSWTQIGLWFPLFFLDKISKKEE